MIDHWLLHDATLMKVDVLGAYFIVEPWCCLTHTMNYFQRCALNLNQMLVKM